ncbi:MAG: HD-GYP domain-containing protein [Coriobacteriia bacterium]|nr:HD-GYP domain-containing protein [Coriobacteriia bacterium]
MIRAFDIVATLGFGVTLIASVVVVVGSRNAANRRLALLLIAAMGIMTAVSLYHAMMWFPSQGAEDLTEDYAQTLFLPLVLYAMHGLYSRSEAERAERARASVTELSTRLAASLEELSGYRVNVFQSLTAAVDARDHYTALHSLHVADYAVAIGEHLDLHDRLSRIEQAALLHDIGKIAIADAILLKPASLDADEYAEIKRHAQVSAEIIGGIPVLADLVPGVRHHHERWDGAGYPDRLAAEEIPLEARVLAVADAFDAMTSDRPYREGISLETARMVLLEERGRQFDPGVVDAFVALLDDGTVTIGDHNARGTQRTVPS